MCQMFTNRLQYDIKSLLFNTMLFEQPLCICHFVMRTCKVQQKPMDTLYN